jgi:NADH:ubiquinone oxidoreductase subunit 5 (subunit L)/multisubunit Na+/H+ antiporter MnhA subunit
MESLISFGWMLHVGQKVFFGATTPAACVRSDPPWPMAAVLVVLMIGCLFAPAIAMSLVDFIGG